MGRLAASVSSRLHHAGKLMRTDVGVYVMEAAVYAAAIGLVGNNMNLFAIRMGASDYHLSLFQMAPHIAQMLILLPGGVLTDAMAVKKKVVLRSLAATAAAYAAMAFTPLMKGAGLFGYLALYSVSVASTTMYGLGWNTFFTEVVPIEGRNGTLAVWYRWNFLLGVVTPLATGFILSGLKEESAKIAAHQAFFIVAAALIVAQIFILNKLNAKNPAPAMGVSLAGLKKAGAALIRNRKFLFFCGAIFVFYMSWQVDWTLYFIGETKYLGMNEAMLSFAVIGGALAQFLTIRFWSRQNERRGVTFPLFFAAAGLLLYPPLMIFCVGLPAPVNRYVFVVGYSLIGLSQTTVSLNILQCLLQVLPEDYRTLSISIFTMLTSLSNAVMPMAGVAVYNLLGANLRALRLACWIVLGARVLSAGLWLYRWYVTEKKQNIYKINK